MTIDRPHQDARASDAPGAPQGRRPCPWRAGCRPARLGPDAQGRAARFVSAQTTEATGLDPQLVPAFSRSRRSPMMYNQLVRFDPDMNPVPELAESWEVSKDGLTWTFKLRQGVKFHDGQEMTSADVKFTFDRLFEKSPGKSDFIAVDKVEPAGRYAVKFVTKEPFAGLLAALGGFWGFIISEAGIKKYGDLNKAALGTGPFMLEDWKVEQQMVLKRHPGYFKKGVPYVDEVVLRIIPDEANIVAALRTGQIQHAFIEDNKNYNLLKDEKTLTGYRSSRLGYDFLNINASRGPLKDVRVRQAISWTVDRAQVLRVAAAGFGRLTAPATAPMKQWQLPEEQWMRYYKPDVDKAKKLMADAGQAGGFTVKLAGDPDVPDHGLGCAGGRRPAQEDRHQRRDRERRVRGVDQAVAGQGLRHDHEHHAGLRRSRHRLLPRASFHQGPELEQLERARAGRPPRGRPPHDGPEEAQGDLRPRADHDSRERAAPLALLGRHHRFHPDLREGLQAAPDDAALRLRGRLARQGPELESRAVGATRRSPYSWPYPGRADGADLPHAPAHPGHGRRADDRRRRDREPGHGGGAEALLRARPAVVRPVRTLARRARPGRSGHLVAHRQARRPAHRRTAAGDARADRARRRVLAGARHRRRHRLRPPPGRGHRQRHAGRRRSSASPFPSSGRARC